MGDLRETALVGAAERIAGYREGLGAARVTPVATRAEVRGALGDFGDGPTPLDDVIEELVSGATPGLMSSAGPRYFGFVTGGSVDAALVAETLAAGWDQCAFNEAMSPAAVAFEDVAGGWLKEMLGLPTSASVGFVTGAQAANTVGLASARWSVLHDRGWDVDRDGLHGAPRVRVVVGAERHATIDRAVRLLGLGEGSLAVVPALADGAMDAEALGGLLHAGTALPTIVCAAGGQREHRRVRRPRGSGRAGPRRRRVGARRRCVRAVGRGEPVDVRSSWTDRAGGFVGVRRAQVAERPVRLRATCSAPIPTSTRRRCRTRPRT